MLVQMRFINSMDHINLSLINESDFVGITEKTAVLKERGIYDEYVCKYSLPVISDEFLEYIHPYFESNFNNYDIFDRFSNGKASATNIIQDGNNNNKIFFNNKVNSYETYLLFIVLSQFILIYPCTRVFHCNILAQEFTVDAIISFLRVYYKYLYFLCHQKY